MLVWLTHSVQAEKQVDYEYTKVVYNMNMKGETNLKTVKGLRLNTDIVKAVQEQAKQEHRSFTNMVEVILSEYLK